MAQKILSHLLAFVAGVALVALYGISRPIDMTEISDAIEGGISGINLEIRQSSPDLSGLDKIKKSELHFTTIIQAEKVNVTASQVDSIGKTAKIFRVPSMMPATMPIDTTR